MAKPDLNIFPSQISTRQLKSSPKAYLQARKLNDLLRLQLRISLARGLKVHDEKVVELLRGDTHAALLLWPYVNPTASGMRIRMTEGVATQECIVTMLLESQVLDVT